MKKISHWCSTCLLIVLCSTFSAGALPGDTALIPVVNIQVANQEHILLHNCQEERDSLASRILTHQENDMVSERATKSLQEENRTLQAVASADQVIITSRENAINKQKKRTLLWQISTAVLLVLTVIR